MKYPETYLLHRGGQTIQMVPRHDYDDLVAELKKVKAARNYSPQIERAKVLLRKVLAEKVSVYLNGRLTNGIRGYLKDE